MKNIYYSDSASVKIISLDGIRMGNRASIGLVKLCDGQAFPFGVVSTLIWSDSLQKIRFSSFSQEEGPGVGLPGVGFYSTLEEARKAYLSLMIYCDNA